ncbi:hypothetical protein EQ500_05315 [Lactobacillus sp. XV13L]|nr:hypothetical protein [Lactobacillus sp. XV13L]
MANIQDFLEGQLTLNDCKKRLMQAFKTSHPALEILTPALLQQQVNYKKIITKQKAQQQRLNRVLTKGE